MRRPVPSFSPTTADSKCFGPNLTHLPFAAKRRVVSALRTAAPSLALVLFASAAHAQGSIDFTQAQTTFTTIKTFVVAVGALFVLMGLVFAAVRMMGNRMAEGALGIVAALIGALVIGLGPGWVTSLSGQVTQ